MDLDITSYSNEMAIDNVIYNNTESTDINTIVSTQRDL